MNNTRDYAYEGSMYAPVDSFYGKGTISSTVNQISLQIYASKIGDYLVEIRKIREGL